MSSSTDNLYYTLAKRIPDMQRGFTIMTNYGDIFIESDEAAPIVEAVRLAIEKNLQTTLAAQGQQS